jgi:hypothetical protein
MKTCEVTIKVKFEEDSYDEISRVINKAFQRNDMHIQSVVIDNVKEYKNEKVQNS